MTPRHSDNALHHARPWPARAARKPASWVFLKAVTPLRRSRMGAILAHPETRAV